MPIFHKYKSLLFYSAALAFVLLLLRWMEWQLIFINNSFEVYAGLIAVIFTLLGVWVAMKVSKPKTVLIEKEILIKADAEFKINEKVVSELGLSKRELEILELTAKGLSNKEIADQLFLSLNTIKTHLSNMFLKLDVQRRTQALEKARRLGLIP
ncbi:MAG: LuxR C-terminal-related transcriptional regulator [Mucilaginibacter sp.]